MSRRDELYLADIIEAASHIKAFLEKLEKQDRDSFLGDELVRSAVLQKMTIIGEAAARISEETRAQYSEVPWHQVRGMRNILVHAYFSVNWDIVWDTATLAVPLFADQITKILEEESSS